MGARLGRGVLLIEAGSAEKLELLNVSKSAVKSAA
jgi:hypothetical protein